MERRQHVDLVQGRAVGRHIQEQVIVVQRIVDLGAEHAGRERPRTLPHGPEHGPVGAIVPGPVSPILCGQAHLPESRHAEGAFGVDERQLVVLIARGYAAKGDDFEVAGQLPAHYQPGVVALHVARKIEIRIERAMQARIGAQGSALLAVVAVDLHAGGIERAARHHYAGKVPGRRAAQRVVRYPGGRRKIKGLGRQPHLDRLLTHQAIVGAVGLLVEVESFDPQVARFPGAESAYILDVVQADRLRTHGGAEGVVRGRDRVFIDALRQRGKGQKDRADQAPEPGRAANDLEQSAE